MRAQAANRLVLPIDGDSDLLDALSPRSRTDFGRRHGFGQGRSARSIAPIPFGPTPGRRRGVRIACAPELARGSGIIEAADPAGSQVQRIPCHPGEVGIGLGAGFDEVRDPAVTEGLAIRRTPTPRVT